MIVTDLEKVSPQGRLDVLIFNGVKYYAKHLEETRGINGLWDSVKPIVNEAIVKGVSGIDVPPEAKMILGLIQANWK